MSTRAGGFTLLEVLLALAVIALALGAAARSASQGASSAGQLKLRTLALWVAEDRLAGHRARNDWPSRSAQGTQTQAGIEFVWRETVAAAPEAAAMRRIDITVAHAASPEHVLARLAAVSFAPAGKP